MSQSTRIRRLFALPLALIVGVSSARASGKPPEPPARGQAAPVAGPASFAEVVAGAQPKMVKIYGAGGLRGLESYQSGFLISADGYVLTVWSHVLDSDEVIATLNDGRRFEAKLVGADPKTQIAVLKIESENLPHFDLDEAPTAEAGAQILAFSNLFGVATGNEPVSVLHGLIAAKAPLDARSGAFESLYRGPAYILDAITNNPGAAGGALTNREGELLGLLGKELRNALNNTWLNYAIPAVELTASVNDILAGKLIPRQREQRPKPENPLRLAALGIVLVPDALDRTPPYIDAVRDGGPAAAAGLRPDDLIVFVNDRLVQSCRLLAEQLDYLERDAPVELTVLRDQQLLEFTLQAPEKK